jgi:hypothetical protein
MVKHKHLAFILVTSVIFLKCESANSQWQWMPDVCGGYSDDWSAKCRRDSNGNMIDGRTGKVYDSSGNLIRGNSESIDSLYEKASDEKRKGNYIAASQIYMKIISLDPQEAQAYFNSLLSLQANFTSLGHFSQREIKVLTHSDKRELISVLYST